MEGSNGSNARKITTVSIRNGYAVAGRMPDTPEAFQTLIGCDVFDIAHRYIGDRSFDIYCDDNGLLRDDLSVSAVDPEGRAQLVGNLVISRHDDAGVAESLTDEDIELIDSCLFEGRIGDRVFPVLLCSTMPFDPEEACAAFIDDEEASA